MVRIIANLLVCIFIALSSAAYADEITPRESVVTGVVVRAEPSTFSERLGLLRPEETLPFVSDRPGWYEVRLANGATGFVSKRWTLRIETPSEEPFPLTAASPSMFAHFVYVGQGAGAILEFPCGVAVIDTGGQYNGDTEGDRLFNNYLDRFFLEHPQYHQTIDVLFTSHPHQDHLDGLPLLMAGGVPRYRVLHVVDNGQSSGGQSIGKQVRFRNAVLQQNGAYAGVSVTAALLPDGASNAVIDPIPGSIQTTRSTRSSAGRKGSIPHSQSSGAAGSATRWSIWAGAAAITARQTTIASSSASITAKHHSCSPAIWRYLRSATCWRSIKTTVSST